MPLTEKGKEIMKSMKKQYGKKKGEEVFYASKNKGTIKGVEKASEGKMMTFRQFVKKMAGEQISDKEAQRLKTSYIKKIAGSQVSEKEAQRLLKQVPKMKKGKMARVKAVKAGLEKASKTHAAQAKTLGTVLKAAGGKMMKRPMMAKVGVMVGRDTEKKLKEARKRRKADVIKGMGGYMGGGLKEATKKLKAQGYKGGSMANIKARYGTMAQGDIKKGLESSKTQRQKKQDMLAKVTMKLSGAQVSEAEAKRIKSLAANIDRGGNKADVEAKKQALKSIMKNMPKMKEGKMALKPIPEGAKGEGLRKLKAERPDVTRKMGFAKKGKIMKAAMGKSVRGYGAARTSGSGLQDEQLIPGKSLDYYKDLM